MLYTTKVIQKFKGKINTVEFEDEALFWTVEFLLSVTQNNENIKISDEFITAMRDDIKRAIMKTDHIAINEFEGTLFNSMENGDFTTGEYEDKYLTHSRELFKELNK